MDNTMPKYNACVFFIVPVGIGLKQVLLISASKSDSYHRFNAPSAPDPKATANKTIQRLQNQGYVKKEPYRSIFITLKGQEVASVSKKRHIIVLTFLKKLGLDLKTAEADAEGIEHHVSDKTLKKMKKYNKKN